MRLRGPSVVAVVLVLMGATACDGGRPDPPSAVAGPADLRYGEAPVPHPDVTYQPDVVVIGGGGRAIRSVTPDGLIWRLDPNARGAADLATGKVMFVTSRAVGRVLDLRRDGDDLAVTIGPVDITEVIRDGTFASKEPISLADPVLYHAGEPFWTDVDDKPREPAQLPGRFVSAAFHRPKHIPVNGFDMTPICCAQGVGSSFSYNRGGIKLFGSVKLVMYSPTASFYLGIRGGTVTEAEFRINGGAGLHVEFEGGSELGPEHNIDKKILIPVDFSVPIGSILGVPFSATVNQFLRIQTAFGSKNGNIKGAGKYSFTGTLGFGYVNGAFGASVPTNFAVETSLTNSLNGVSVGVNGVVITYQARFYIGIGAFGFTAGIYLGLTAGIGMSLGSPIGSPLALCRGAALRMDANYGVGYTIPVVVAEVINFFLRVFRTRPIQSTGGIGSSAPLIAPRTEVVPNVPLCRG